HPAAARGALAWLAAKKDPNGLWQSTQATVLALKALVAGSAPPEEEPTDRKVVLEVAGQRETVAVQPEVLRLVDLTARLKPGRIGRFQVRPRGVLVYLRELEPGKPLELEYSLRATMPVDAAVPAAAAWEYYDPARRGEAKPGRVTVRAR